MSEKFVSKAVDEKADGMPPAGVEPVIPTSERPQSHTLTVTYTLKGPIHLKLNCAV
jgi:hypothetical protein